jgi:hypothetical protein
MAPEHPDVPCGLAEAGATSRHSGAYSATSAGNEKKAPTHEGQRVKKEHCVLDSPRGARF